MKSRDIAIVGILLAIGAILRYLMNVVPTAIVSNPIIALYCLAIILIRPNVRDTIGIGIVAGIISALISHSIFPPANFISEPLGALVCMALYAATRNHIPLAPTVATFAATLVSGFTFIGVSIVVIASGFISAPGEGFTVGAFIVAVSPVILLTAIANAVIAQVLYIPSSKILMRGAKGEDTQVRRKTMEDESNDLHTPAFRFSGFSYTYPQGTIPALTDVNLIIPRGECVLVNGTTGAGKTTFCLAAAGVLCHEYEGKTEGTLAIFGRDVQGYEDMGDIGRTVGVVFDDADAQLIFTTVEEEVLSGLENRGLKSEEVKTRLEEMLTFTNLTELRYREPHSLSGGQKQRVALAATLASGTDCIILDEATAELDTAATESIIAILTRLREAGKTIIVVEQKPRELAAIADRVITIEHGRITKDETAEAFFATYKDEEPASGKMVDTTSLSQTGEPRIVVDTLVHTYGTNPALRGVSLTIYPGELVAIIGENGSGKTTLVKHLNGLLRPTSGTITVCGMNAAEERVTRLAEKAGLVFQNPDTMLFEDTVEKEMQFGMRNIGVDSITAQERISEVLERVGLSGRLTQFPRAMSRGERQRLAIACVVAMKPDIIILDEPTTGLDPGEANRIMHILKALSEAGHTVIMVSHDMSIVARHAQRIIHMDTGTITSDKTRTNGGRV
ncbi:MAG: energy-coupling factor ABC transporter ATP-binding protein [Methanomicrobiales archaeon]|jgi:energy-coupling factor transport system ATP-binding protein|nr:energy-coupling factor ABC transporter ATP-binding protein [Methanomicrobiales archaeon]